MSLKDSWKQTGTDLGHAFKGLGKSIVKTVKTGADKAADWADKDDAAQAEPNDHTATYAGEEPKE